jgi:hypothetical protein
VTSLWLFVFEEWYTCTSVLDPDPYDLYVFRPLGSASGSVSQIRGMDPRIRIRIRIHTKMSRIRNTGYKWYPVHLSLNTDPGIGVSPSSVLSKKLMCAIHLFTRTDSDLIRPGSGSDPVKPYGTVSVTNVLRDRSVKKLDYLACLGLKLSKIRNQFGLARLCSRISRLYRKKFI